jgi:hypothetical protein
MPALSISVGLAEHLLALGLVGTPAVKASGERPRASVRTVVGMDVRMAVSVMVKHDRFGQRMLGNAA